MTTLKEQPLFAIVGFSFIPALLHAPKSVQLLGLFGLLYTGSIWSCEYLHEINIYVRAAWNARHLHELSEMCRNTISITKPSRNYPWYERYLYCTGELRGLEIWSSYRDYTSPHYLLFYIAIFLFAHLVIIKREWRWLNDVFDIQPAVSDDTVLPPKDALPLPGSYHTLFSLSYVTNINSELEKARENAKDAWDSMAVSCELLEKEFEEELRKASEHGVDIDSLRKEIDFLKRDLKAARGLEEHQKDQLHNFQQAMVNERSRHQKELAAIKAELSAIKNHSSSSEATRHAGSVAKKDADNALLRDQLRIAEREIKRLRYGGSSATDSGQSVLRNRQLLTNNAKLMKNLELAREQVASCEMAHKCTLSQLQEAEKELRPTKAAVHSIKLELERAQKELKATQYGLETTAIVAQEASNKRESRDTVLLGQVEELLKFQNKSASTIQNLNAELQQVKLTLASALAKSSDREREFEQANNDLALQKQSVEDTLDETLGQLKDVKGQLATAQLQQSSNYNDAVHQLNHTTDELQSVRQQLVNMTHQLNRKESDRQYARRQWQEHYDHIQWLYQNWASREKYGKVLAEVQHLKQNGVSKEDYENARAEIVNLKDKIVSLQRPNAAKLTSGGNLAEQLQAKKHELEKAHHQISALHAMNRRLDGQKAVRPNSGSNEVAMLKEKISVLQEHVAQVPKLHKKNKELLSQLQIARDKNAGPPEIASLQRSLDRERRRVTDLKDELEAKARELEQARVKHKHSATHCQKLEAVESQRQAFENKTVHLREQVKRLETDLKASTVIAKKLGAKHGNEDKGAENQRKHQDMGRLRTILDCNVWSVALCLGIG